MAAAGMIERNVDGKLRILGRRGFCLVVEAKMSEQMMRQRFYRLAQIWSKNFYLKADSIALEDLESSLQVLRVALPQNLAAWLELHHLTVDVMRDPQALSYQLHRGQDWQVYAVLAQLKCLELRDWAQLLSVNDEQNVKWFAMLFSVYQATYQLSPDEQADAINLQGTIGLRLTSHVSNANQRPKYQRPETVQTLLLNNQGDAVLTAGKEHTPVARFVKTRQEQGRLSLPQFTSLVNLLFHHVKNFPDMITTDESSTWQLEFIMIDQTVITIRGQIGQDVFLDRVTRLLQKYLGITDFWGFTGPKLDRLVIMEMRLNRQPCSTFQNQEELVSINRVTGQLRGLNQSGNGVQSSEIVVQLNDIDFLLDRITPDAWTDLQWRIHHKSRNDNEGPFRFTLKVLTEQMGLMVLTDSFEPGAVPRLWVEIVPFIEGPLNRGQAMILFDRDRLKIRRRK